MQILRDYLIGDEFSEAHNQQQNPVERNAIRWLKRYTKVLLDRTNAPPELWLEAMKYLADVHNHTAKESLRWAIPITLRHGETCDISHLLMFMFMEPVYYSSYDSFPDSDERLGYWTGTTHNVGDTSCHRILDAETYKFHETGTVRPVDTSKNPNFRVGVPGVKMPPTFRKHNPTIPTEEEKLNLNL